MTWDEIKSRWPLESDFKVMQHIMWLPDWAETANKDSFVPVKRGVVKNKYEMTVISEELYEQIYNTIPIVIQANNLSILRKELNNAGS